MIDSNSNNMININQNISIYLAKRSEPYLYIFTEFSINFLYLYTTKTENMKKILFVLVAIAMFACKNNNQGPAENDSSKSANLASPSTEKSGDLGGISLEKIWETEGKLTTAEGVAFDESKGVYYVSCIGGVPILKEDGDGFIATLDQRGNILNLSFATGLDAPKGMAVGDGNLYVTDINEFVIIDIESGSMQRLAIQGAKFLNDVALAPDGSVYFTDMNTSTIYRYTDEGGVKKYLQDDRLSNPNGIYVDNETIYVVSFSTGDFNAIDIDSKSITKKTTGTFPNGDGVAPWEKGFMVSDWAGAVYYTNSTWEAEKILDTTEEKKNAADIIVNQKAGEILVPTFFGNSVAAYKIVNK